MHNIGIVHHVCFHHRRLPKHSHRRLDVPLLFLIASLFTSPRFVAIKHHAKEKTSGRKQEIGDDILQAYALIVVVD